MNIHKNARLTPQGRVLLVRRITEEGWRIVDAANAAGASAMAFSKASFASSIRPSWPTSGRSKSPGGTCTHWKAPTCHGAHPKRSLVPSHAIRHR